MGKNQNLSTGARINLSRTLINPRAPRPTAEGLRPSGKIPYYILNKIYIKRNIRDDIQNNNIYIVLISAFLLLERRAK